MLDRITTLKNANNTIYKKIERFYPVSHIAKVQNILYTNGIKCPKITKYNIINSSSIEYTYKFIYGKTINTPTEELFEEVNDFINKIKLINNFKFPIVSLYEIIDFYYNNINKKSLSKQIQIFINNIHELYCKIKKIYKCDTFSHGDLDLSNIIKTPNGYVFIDFDECSYMPKNLDWTIFIIRMYFKSRQSNYSNEVILKEIESLDPNLLCLYIYKVIIEKLYLLQEGIIDNDDYEQRQDSYEFWIDLLKEIHLKHQKNVSKKIKSAKKNRMIVDKTNKELIGKLIVFEGNDGSGKSSQIKLLSKYLKSRNINNTIIRYNMSDVTIKSIKIGKKLMFGPYANTYLHLASIIDQIERIIIKELKTGKTIICDRYIYSVIARAIARGIDEKVFSEMSKNLLKPDIVFYLNIEPKISFERLGYTNISFWEAGQDVTGNINKIFSFIYFQNKINDIYLANSETWNLVEINANQDKETVMHQILTILYKEGIISDIYG